MSSNFPIQVNPNRELTNAIFNTLFEWDAHIEEFMALPDYKLSAFNNKAQVIPLITAPLFGYWSALSEDRKLSLKRSLQYLLNLDEKLPYVDDAHSPDYRCKRGSLAQSIRDSCQDTMVPSDGYALCLWMWQILFNDEDWHTDVSSWVVVNEPDIKMEVPEIDSEPASKSEGGFLSKLFGKK
ncbi:MAG: hypothetical protein V4542_14010 [Pseudomonadota bacterium]